MSHEIWTEHLERSGLVKEFTNLKDDLDKFIDDSTTHREATSKAIAKVDTAVKLSNQNIKWHWMTIGSMAGFMIWFFVFDYKPGSERVSADIANLLELQRSTDARHQYVNENKEIMYRLIEREKAAHP